MSIKNLFNKTTTILSAESSSVLVESNDFVITKDRSNKTFQPHIDFSKPENFAKFGLAEEYYKTSIERIHDNYPYDGSKNEKVLFELSSSYLDKYILDKRYPKTNGYINLSYGGWGTQSSIADGYGLSDSNEYILIRGSIHVKSGNESKSLKTTFDKSIVYDEEKDRVSSLKMNLTNGFTTEFWLKKDAFDTSKTEKEVILDMWNGEASSSANYGRFTLALSGTADGENTFIVTLQSGTVGFYEQSIGTSTVTTSSLADWHHYSLSFISASSNITGRLYIDGDINESKSLGSSGINEIGGLINAYIGALQTSPSGSSAAQYSGKLSASLDDFRYWKKRRTSEQIYNNWYRPVAGGANTEDKNVDLGVYYKFNEGILGNSLDSNVLDYSGRLANGIWTGYESGARETSSAFVESGLVASEEKDPIIYSAHPDVVALKTELLASGSEYDATNTGQLYRKVPNWIRDEDESLGFATKKFYQIISSYFDTIYAQISSLPDLKNKSYPSSSYSPRHFAANLLEERGLVVPDLFINSNVLEMFEDADLNQVQYEKKITDIKNQIYTNIYNNLENIYKEKGTESSIRNMLRCFGIDDELVKLNIYTDHGLHYFSDSFKNTNVNKKYINFDKELANSSTIYNTSSATNTLSYISGSKTEKLEEFNALSAEISVIIPRKKKFGEKEYYIKNYLSSSIFGLHQAVDTSSDYTWDSGDLANFQVYLVKEENQSDSGKFVLKDYDNNINLETDVFKEIYSNEKWNLAVRIKPEDYPIAGNVVTSSNRNYILEFYGVTHAFDNVKEEFLLTSSLNYTTGSSYLSNNKRFYIGAHRENFTGSVLNKSDVKVGRFNVWLDYLENDVIKLHNRDITSKGNYSTTKPSTIFGKDLENTEIPSYELSILDWNFETVSSSDSSGEFIVIDTTSGSTDSRYGWTDNIIRRKNDGAGNFFPVSSQVFVSSEIVNSSKKELPEISYSSDNILIKGQREELFIEDEDVSDNFYALEKSMYQVVSEEMMNTLATAQEMSNLMGEAVERYRLEYKKLNNIRRIFFENVENDLDLDRFTEYFKWIDSSISLFVSQLFPISSRFSKGISDVVESHLFERNKYQNKFPLISTHTATEGRIIGVGQSQYSWKFGHAPLSGDDNDNCLWQKERSEREDITERQTINDIIQNRNNAPATILASKDRTSYSGSAFATRRFSKTIQLNAVVSQTLHAGTNYNLQKNRNYLWSAVNRHSQLNSVGTPVNVMLVGAGPGQGLELPRECNDVEVPNQKKKFNSTVFIGKQAAGAPGGAFSPINDSASYEYALKGHQMFPFNFVSGNITTGYNSSVASGYKSDVVLTNLHSDTTDFSNDIPMQGPFTQQWVGGHQSRHIDLNRYDTSLIDGETLSAPTNNIHNLYTRPEAWRLVVVEAGGSSDGALGLVDPEYGVTAISGHPNSGSYPDVAKKSATLFRDLRTKRPVNVANIQTTTSSINYGNFTENYEIISAVGKNVNNLFFRKYNETHNFLPDAIADILPETTNYQTLMGVSNHPSGNVFGIGESNILNATSETFSSDVTASYSFRYSNNHTSTVLTLETDGNSFIIESLDPNDAPTNTNADLLLYSGSDGTALGSNTTSYFSASNSSYSGLSNNPYSISFWYYSDTDTGNTQIQTLDGGAYRLRIIMQGDIQVNALNNGGGGYTATFNTDIYDTTEWKHVVLTLDVDSNFEPNLWVNGVRQTQTGWPESHPGVAPTIDGFKIVLSHENRMQDIVVWKNKLLNQTEIDLLYAKGNWANPSTHASRADINDWYKFGYEDYWSTLGYSNGDVLNSIGSPPYTISSSFGTGANDITIAAATDQYASFFTGSNPFGSAKTPSEIANEISSSMAPSFSDWTITTNAAPGSVELTQTSAQNTSTSIVKSGTPGTAFINETSTNGSLAYIETGYLNTTTIATESVTRTVISSRFSAPGSIDTLTYGFLDAYSQEYSVYNSLNYRNLSVRGAAVRVSSSADSTDFYNFGGSGESGTIRVDDHRGERDSHKALLSRHSGKFGIDPRYASELGSDPLEQANPDPSFHKQQRNENRRPSDTSTISSPVLIVRHDNMLVSSPIPRSDFQYKWVTCSVGSNYSITSGKQRMYGYAHPTGILSSSVTIDGDSGFVPAITFPTASEIFGE